MPERFLSPASAIQPARSTFGSGRPRAARLALWHGHRFRSVAEMRIAQCLDQAGVLFVPNGLVRLGVQKRENRRPDFLVCCEGRWGIIEVDGQPYHPSAARDHDRDRLFLRHGVKLVQHFTAAECFHSAPQVVEQFLAILKQA